MKQRYFFYSGLGWLVGLSLQGQCNFTLSSSSTPASCFGDLDGSATVIANSGSGNFTYSWNTNPIQTTNSITNVPAGTYNVTVTDLGDNCSLNEVVTIGQPSRLTMDVGFDTSICRYQPMTLRSVVLGGTPPYGYNWSCNQPACNISDPATFNPVIQANNSTVYYFYATDANGCATDVDSVQVSVLSLPSVDAGQDQFMYLTESVNLEATATTTGSFTWWPTDFLSHPDSQATEAGPNTTTTYQVYFEDSFGCRDTGSVLVEVETDVTVATGFTPNGDGVNDAWVIKNLVNFPMCKIYVFNRTGQELYYAEGNNQFWDGTYNGTAQPAGTYYYVIDLDGTSPKMKGSFTLIR